MSTKSYSLAELAQHAGVRLIGDPEHRITGVATLQSAGPAHISFLTNSRYRRYLLSSGAGAVILRESDMEGFSGNAIVGDDPHTIYARIASLFAPDTGAEPGVHRSAVVSDRAELGQGVSIGPHAVIEPGAVLGEGVIVGPGCVVGRDAKIGAGSRLVANVTIYHGCTLGERCLVHAGTVIGADGFGFANDRGSWVKVPQLGVVRIGDDVEIGACTTIDRGAVEDTIIEDGAKLDNLIQVAHNVRIGAHTAVAACVGIAGSATIGSRCAIAGGAGILGHLTIPDGTTITAMSLVTKSIREPGIYAAGTPLEPMDQWQKNFARFKQLDDMARRIRALEKALQKQEQG